MSSCFSSKRLILTFNCYVQFWKKLFTVTKSFRRYSTKGIESSDCLCSVTSDAFQARMGTGGGDSGYALCTGDVPPSRACFSVSVWKGCWFSPTVWQGVFWSCFDTEILARIAMVPFFPGKGGNFMSGKGKGICHPELHTPIHHLVKRPPPRDFKSFQCILMVPRHLAKQPSSRERLLSVYLFVRIRCDAEMKMSCKTIQGNAQGGRSDFFSWSWFSLVSPGGARYTQLARF